jgi:hypothetical protein
LSAARGYDAKKARAAVDQSITVLLDIVDRIDMNRISIARVRRELWRLIVGPLARALKHSTFNE